MQGFLGLDSVYTEYASSRVTVVPVPFEQTTSYMQGTRRGPEAIIDASGYVELYDEELDKEIYTVGIHTMPPLLFDAHIEDDFRMITDQFRELLDAGKFVVALGGEHSISYPVFRAFQGRYKKLSVVQLDAHADLRDEYEESKYSHACVMRRIREHTDRVEQVGIRSLSVEEARLIQKHQWRVTYAHHIRQNGFPQELADRLEEHVFITIDLDYFDPSIIPSTGTPEPGGFYWQETLEFLRQIFRKRNVVGFDVVELSPIKGLAHPDFMAARLVYKLLGYKFAEIV